VPEVIVTGTFLALVLVLSARGGRLEIDGPLLFVQLRSVVIDHDLDLTNEFAEFVPERYQYWAEEGQKLGRTPNPTVEPGPAILWAPFFLLVHAVVLVARLWNAPLRGRRLRRPLCQCRLPRQPRLGLRGRDPRLPHRAPHLLAASLRHLCLGRVARHALVWYSAFEPGMSHATASAAAGAFVWRWLRMRDDPASRKRWLLTGARRGRPRLDAAVRRLLPVGSAPDGRGVASGARP
jgi:hypothetical protein